MPLTSYIGSSIFKWKSWDLEYLSLYLDPGRTWAYENFPTTTEPLTPLSNVTAY